MFPTFAETNREEMLKYFREMNLHRRVEITCDEIYKMKEVRGFCHLMDGQVYIALIHFIRKQSLWDQKLEFPEMIISLLHTVAMDSCWEEE